MSRAPLGRPFLTVWSGQALSAIGSSVSGIGVAVFVFIETGSATALGWFIAIASVPFVITAPLIPFTDRFTRRSVMIAGDSLAVIGPVIALTLAITGSLEVWHLAASAFVGGLGTSFQVPAAQAAVPALVAADAIDRANGLGQIGPAAGVVLGPVMATPIVAHWGVEAVLLIDILTFVVAVGLTMMVPFADAEGAAVDDDGSWAAARSWLVTAGRPLLTLLGVMALTNFALSFFNVSILIVATEVGGVSLAGVALGVGGAAMLVGSVVSARLGVRPDRLGVVARGLVVTGLGIVLTAIRPVFGIVVFGVAVALSAVPALSAAGSTIFHERVPPSMYGRIFGLRAFLGRALDPVGAVIAGVLVADVAEPAMSETGALAGWFGPVFGTGDGRGAAVVLAAAGLALVATGSLLHRSPARKMLRAGDLSESSHVFSG